MFTLVEIPIVCSPISIKSPHVEMEANLDQVKQGKKQTADDAPQIDAFKLSTCGFSIGRRVLLTMPRARKRRRRTG